MYVTFFQPSMYILIHVQFWHQQKYRARLNNVIIRTTDTQTNVICYLVEKFFEFKNKNEKDFALHYVQWARMEYTIVGDLKQERNSQRFKSRRGSG